MLLQAAIDKIVGLVLMSAAIIIFAYYSTWTLVTPFVDAEHPIQALFPDRQLALLLPAVLLVLGITGVATFVGVVLSKAKAKKKSA